MLVIRITAASAKLGLIAQAKGGTTVSGATGTTGNSSTSAKSSRWASGTVAVIVRGRVLADC